MLEVLRRYGFQPWSIGEVIEVATSWPSAIGITVIVIVLLLLRPISGLLERTSDAEGEWAKWRVKFRDPRDSTLQKAEEVSTADRSSPPPLPPVPVEAAKEEESRTEDVPAAKNRDAKDGDSSLDDYIDALAAEQEAAEKGQMDFREIWQWLRKNKFLVNVDQLREKLLLVPEMRKFTYGELEHAYSILSGNFLNSHAFLNRLISNRTVIEFLDGNIAARTARPRGNALDPVSFCSWGSLLVTTNMASDAKSRVIREIVEAAQKGILE